VSWERELLVRCDMLLTHHDRYGRGVVRPGLPDVFVLQGKASPRDYDIAVRIDGGYGDKGMARWCAKGWQELVDAINTLRREHKDELHSAYSLL